MGVDFNPLWLSMSQDDLEIPFELIQAQHFSPPTNDKTPTPLHRFAGTHQIPLSSPYPCPSLPWDEKWNLLVIEVLHDLLYPGNWKIIILYALYGSSDAGGEHTVRSASPVNSFRGYSQMPEYCNQKPLPYSTPIISRSASGFLDRPRNCWYKNP